MKSFSKPVLISFSVLALGVATQAQADFVIPTLQGIQESKTAISYCNNYADNAIQQFAKSQSLGCGFSGPRWNNDRKGQYNWCLTVLEPFALTDSGFRDDALAACLVTKSSGNNPQNQVAVPQACRDPSKAYTAVKQINHYFRYDFSLTSPVKNGLISYDYNRDKKPDYVFLETKDNRSRVAMCFSGGQRYRRQLSDIAFSSGSDSLGSSNYEITQQGDMLLIRIDEFEHDAGSSYRKLAYRFDVVTGKFKNINNQAGTSPLSYDGQPYPMSPPETPILF